MEIEINNNIGNFEVCLISPNGENLGLITNVVSLDNVRRQIKEKELSGYKLLFNGEIIAIDKYGTLEYWPDELCYHTGILAKLI